MAQSIDELKNVLNIKTIKTDWNNLFPNKKELLDVAKNTSFFDEMNNFVDALVKTKLNKEIITLKTITKICVLAESFGLFMGIINTTPEYIELFFIKSVSTDKRMEMFKPHLTRKQFFNCILSCGNFKEYTTIFSDRTRYYQTISPKIPDGYSAKLIKLNNDLILVKYTSDFALPVLKIFKLTNNGCLVSIPYNVKYNKSVFNSITLTVDNKTFTGDAFTRLWDGEEKQTPERYIKIKIDKKLYSLDTDTCNVTISDYEALTITKTSIDPFRKIQNGVSLLLTENVNNNTFALLDNGYVWNLTKNKFIDVITMFGSGNDVNLDLLTMSSNSKGVILSRMQNSVEIIPCDEFFKLFL